MLRDEPDYRYRPAGLGLVCGIAVPVVGVHDSPQPVIVRVVRQDRHRGDGQSAPSDVDVDMRVGLQVVVPTGCAGSPPLEATTK